MVTGLVWAMLGVFMQELTKKIKTIAFCNARRFTLCGSADVRINLKGLRKKPMGARPMSWWTSKNTLNFTDGVNISNRP